MQSATDLDLLIIIPPARVKNTMWPPYGAMYVAAYLRSKGHHVQILNVDTERISPEQVVERIRLARPAVIGFSGMVATSYGYIKGLSGELKKSFPHTYQILGGGLASAAEVILKNTAIDIVVHGEGELTADELLCCIKVRKAIGEVRGIYYKDGRSIIFTEKRPLIADLDMLPYPAFDLIDMSHYLGDGLELIHTFTKKADDKRIYDKKRSPKLINILTNRGCIGTCSFCVRPDPGLRMHSIKHVFDLIEYCIETFGVGFLSFGDECFAPNKRRNWEFIEEYKRRKLNIVFRILGLRVDTVDREILRAYKEIGCWMINYGFESGSQKVLNLIDKRVDVEQNKKVAVWTREAGIYTPAQIILGMPGETDQTIDETIHFLKSLDFDFKQYKWTHALPIPGSPLYDYAKLSGAIVDEDEYLSSLGAIEGTAAFHVNLTDEPDEVVEGWPVRIKNELDRHYLGRKYGIKGTFLVRAALFLSLVELHLRRGDIFYRILKKTRDLFAGGKKATAGIETKRFHKRNDITVEPLLQGYDWSVVNREMTLKKINRRLAEKAGVGI